MNVLIVHTWGIGDLILLTPVLNAVHKLHPQVRIHFLFFPKAAAIPVKEAPYVGEINYCSWKPRALLSAIIGERKRCYEAVMFSSGVTPWKAWLFLLLLKAKKRIGEYHKCRLPFISAAVKFDAQLSRTESNYRLLSSFLHLPKWKDALAQRDELDMYTSFHLKESNKQWAEEYLTKMGFGEKKLVGLHPGCMAKNSYRRWDKEKFVELITMIRSEYNFDFLVIAGPDELDVGKFISQQSECRLLNDTPLSDVAAVIARCDYFINTDSSLGHIASCFRVKSLTIFGPGNEKQTAPFSPDSRIVRNSISCAPCVGAKKIACEVDCLKQLSAERVMQELRGLFL